MADGVAITAGSGTTIATDDAGAPGHVQLFKLAISTDGSATLIPADAANGLDVDVTRLPALAAGTNNIGDVDVLTMPTVTTKHAGSTGAQTSVAGTVTANTTLIAADSARFGLIIFNDSTAELTYLLGAGTQSATVFTGKLGPSGYYEVPEAFVAMRVSGQWATATGSARITAAT